MCRVRSTAADRARCIHCQGTHRSRENMARQSQPISGLGFQGKVMKICYRVSSWLCLGPPGSINCLPKRFGEPKNSYLTFFGAQTVNDGIVFIHFFCSQEMGESGANYAGFIGATQICRP